MVFKLRDFDAFLDCARGCNHVFFKVEATSKGKRVIAYAGRVWWEEIFVEGSLLKDILDTLKDVGANEVLTDTDVEQIFR